MSEVHVVTSGVVFHSPAVSPANANSQPIVTSGSTANRNATVKGNVVGGSVVIGNPG